ncbi:MobA/MobL family protein [Sphingomonas sp. CGMCC 1.13654]|uniref:MobA/MobL family protein n=1 Tax=Sphingomonas chungangi TaxID=2683589 RepID=A0A838L6P2_9SPHN|nr:MobA/MobL family protein [Sphingomonas chungangi]MBA2935153.1 MobA/MobL family protein [Sphingomonas chungangi]
MAGERWFCRGRRCRSSDLAHILDEKRAEKRKRSVALHRAVAARRQDEKDLRALKAALRRLVRMQERENRVSIRAIVKPRRGSGGGRGRNRAFESMLSLNVPKRRGSSGGGLSSFHLRFRSRGLGARRRNRSHIFRQGETVKSLLYILRDDAREIPGGGIVSNLGTDVVELAGCFDALETLERQDRANAHVYSMLVVSLPHELEPAERLDVLRSICALLGEHDLGHVGVLHAPDPEGDDRNFHAHILLSWRPIERVGSNVFSFSAEKHSDLNDASFILPFRHRVESILNAAMEEAGHERRFTALSDAARGLPPRTKASGKSTPGQKAVERKQRKVDEMSARRDVLHRIRDAVTTIRTATDRMMALGSRDWLAEAAVARSASALASAPEPVQPTPASAIKIIPQSSPVVDIVSDPKPADRIEDSARRAFVDRLVEGLKDYAWLPLREAQGVRTPSGAPTPALELHIRNRDRSDSAFLADIDRMSGEPQIQAALSSFYQNMLQLARGELTQGRMRRPDIDMQDIGTEMESRDFAFRDAIAVARKDAAFDTMLAEVRRWWDQRDREAADFKREQAQARRRSAAASLDVAALRHEPKAWHAFQRLATDLVAGRVILFRDDEGLGMRRKKGATLDDAKVVAHHPEGKALLTRLADLLAPQPVAALPTGPSQRQQSPTSTIGDDGATPQIGDGPSR